MSAEHTTIQPYDVTNVAAIHATLRKLIDQTITASELLHIKIVDQAKHRGRVRVFGKCRDDSTPKTMVLIASLRLYASGDRVCRSVIISDTDLAHAFCLDQIFNDMLRLARIPGKDRSD